MDSLLPVVNQLQELYNHIDESGSSREQLPSLLDLPQIAVVGSQSVGKSSIIDGIVAHSFVPKGNGMTTKCPLILQLRNTTSHVVAAKVKGAKSESLSRTPQESSNFYAEFAHLPAQTFTDTQSILEEISQRTQTILNENTHNESSTPIFISAKPIILRFHSPQLVDLTLIDLPGLIRVPTADQPPDIEDQVKRIVLQYIRNPNCIILAVSAANVDLANSDSLRIAREVDPAGQRTIGVLTKCDLVDDASVILSILEGKVYPLRRGYIPVRCLSQKERVPGCNLDEATKLEARFFLMHPVLAPVAGVCGVPFLARKLSQILAHHIRLFLPSIKATIDVLLSDVQMEMKRLGVHFDLKSADAAAFLLQVFTKYSRTVDDLLDGREYIPSRTLDSPRSNCFNDLPSTCELVGGARLHYVFQDWFAPSIMKSDPLARLSDGEIRTAIRNASGPSSSLFVPEAAFEMLVKKQIKWLEQPAIQCVHQAVHELTTITEFPMCLMSEFKRFPTLENRAREITKEVILSNLSTALSAVTDLIRVELSFINKSHPDFIGGKKAIANYLSARSTAHCVEEKSRAQGGPSTSAVNTGPDQPLMSGEPEAARLAASQTPTTGGNSDSDDCKNGIVAPGQQSFLSFWRRHPLQQTPAPPAPLTTRPSASSARPSLPPMYSRATTAQVLKAMSPGLALPMMAPEGTTDTSDKDGLELELVKSLITSYFDIVKKTLSDLVPKIIMHFLVNASREALRGELVSRLYREELFESLLEEAALVTEARQKAHKSLEILQKAQNILSKVNKGLIASQTTVLH